MARIKKWRGKEISQAVAQNVAKALGEYGLRVEGRAKKKLKKGHGLITATLQRSIHTAQPDYNWSGDDVEPGPGTPERGNQQFDAMVDGKRITIQVGSGLVYAMAIHQGWSKGYKGMQGSFEGYHFITDANEETKPELPAVLKKYRLEK
jgi:hypothetical protein